MLGHIYSLYLKFILQHIYRIFKLGAQYSFSIKLSNFIHSVKSAWIWKENIQILDTYFENHQFVGNVLECFGTFIISGEWDDSVSLQATGDGRTFENNY